MHNIRILNSSRLLLAPSADSQTLVVDATDRLYKRIEREEAGGGRGCLEYALLCEQWIRSSVCFNCAHYDRRCSEHSQAPYNEDGNVH